MRAWLSRCLRWVGRVFKRKAKSTLEPGAVVVREYVVSNIYEALAANQAVTKFMNENKLGMSAPVPYWQKRPEGKQ